jgi:hypothetical protein
VNRDGIVNLVDVQLVINAAIRLGCSGRLPSGSARHTLIE